MRYSFGVSDYRGLIAIKPGAAAANAQQVIYMACKGKNADAYIKAEVAKMKEQLLQEIKTNNGTTKTLIQMVMLLMIQIPTMA